MFQPAAGLQEPEATAAAAQCLELPRPVRLVRTAGLNLAESFGLPTGAYIVAAALAGRDAGLWAMLAAIWLTAATRKLLTGAVPVLVLISLMVLTVQTVIAIATGNLLIFLVHFPLADLGLCILFARTARGDSPICGRLAAEVIGLRCPAVHQPHLDGFFRRATVLWAGVFGLLAIALAVLLATVPLGIYVPVWAATTIALIVMGIGVSIVWMRSMLRRSGIGFRFAPAAAT
jgi:hypothetical protein